LPIAALGVVSLGRERQVTGAVANSHYRGVAAVGGARVDGSKGVV
jgi:hypothetical protein